MTDQPQNYQIGEKEYSLDELQTLIDKGSYALEMEKEFNTDFKGAWSAYGKSQNKVKELEDALEVERKAKADAAQSAPTTSQLPNLDEELSKRGYLSKEDADKLLDEKLTYREQVQAIASQFKKLEGEITGEDGRPKFETEKVLGYMKENNLIDPQKAYDMMNLDEISNWKAEQIAKKPGFAPSNTSNTASNKQPQPVTYNRDNVDMALREVLSESQGKI